MSLEDFFQNIGFTITFIFPILLQALFHFKFSNALFSVPMGVLVCPGLSL